MSSSASNISDITDSLDEAESALIPAIGAGTEHFLESITPLVCKLPPEIRLSLMANLESRLNKFFSCETFVQSASGSTPLSSSNAPTSFGDPSVSNTGTNSRKSQRYQRGSQNDDDDDRDSLDGNQNEDIRKKRLKTYHAQIWACPYYKREPHRYGIQTELCDFRRCANGFAEIHRIKQVVFPPCILQYHGHVSLRLVALLISGTLELISINYILLVLLAVVVMQPFPWTKISGHILELPQPAKFKMDLDRLMVLMRTRQSN
jgi:hypothetical protein